MPQTWNPDGYDRHARFVSELGRPLIDLLDPQPGERVLDVGCGDGALTQELAARGCNVVGVDNSEEFVRAAKSRGLDARLVDAQQLNFDEEFDAAFSNAALHWMLRPDDVLAGVYRALVRGGRFVGEFGGDGNVATVMAGIGDALDARGIDAGAVNPWYFPAVDEYRSKLESAGFSVASIELIPRPTPLAGEMSDWLQTFAGSFLQTVAAEERDDLCREICGRLRRRLCTDGQWTVDYVRLRFKASKSAADRE